MRFGDDVSASCSQPYYLDVTHPNANKGFVVRRLATLLNIPTESIATIGDGPNDVLMFAVSGLSVAMGNACLDVRCAAGRVTGTNITDGFAEAVQKYIIADCASQK
jgi:hydroxymethylpyrimidine pyrophosphatase-like HAD family hydrolase